jgi:periplasmic protein TonB
MGLSRCREMFGGFEKRVEHGASRRYGVTTLVAAAVLVGAAGIAVALQEPEKKKEEEEVVDVTFVKPDEPPPPPVVVIKPPPTAKATTTNRPPPISTAPPPPPKKIERDPLPLGDADKFQPTTGPDTGGDVGPDLTAMDLGGGGGEARPAPAIAKPPPPPPKPKAPRSGNDPIVMPEDATPPKRIGSDPPEFPSEARAAGLEGEVYLKIVINADGTVGEIEVKKGEEPFVSAAIAAVKTWKYSPALVDGKPTAVYRTIKVPFRLSN